MSFGVVGMLYARLLKSELKKPVSQVQHRYFSVDQDISGASLFSVWHSLYAGLGNTWCYHVT